MFSSINKTKINVWLLQRNFWLQQQKKKIFVVPNFVAIKKTIFSVDQVVKFSITAKEDIGTERLNRYDDVSS